VDLPDLVYYEEDVLENEKPRCRLERTPWIYQTRGRATNSSGS